MRAKLLRRGLIDACSVHELRASRAHLSAKGAEKGGAPRELWTLEDLGHPGFIVFQFMVSVQMSSHTHKNRTLSPSRLSGSCRRRGPCYRGSETQLGQCHQGSP
jgi:hypothetical protein